MEKDDSGTLRLPPTKYGKEGKQELRSGINSPHLDAQHGNKILDPPRRSSMLTQPYRFTSTTTPSRMHTGLRASPTSRLHTLPISISTRTYFHARMNPNTDQEWIRGLSPPTSKQANSRQIPTTTGQPEKELHLRRHSAI